MNQTKDQITRNIRDGYKKMGIPVLSYSSLTLYDGCPYCYYLKYICGVKQKWISPNLIFGTLIHKILENEKVLKSPSMLNELIDDTIEYELRYKYLLKSSTAQIKNDVIKMTELIKNNPLMRGDKPIILKEREREIIKSIGLGYPLNSFAVHAKIDGLTDRNEIVEHKTSSIKYTEKKIRESHQHVIYAIMAGCDTVIYDILYKAKDPIREQITINVSKQDKEKTIEWMNKLATNIIKEIWTPYKNINYQHLMWCDHKNMCPYCSKKQRVKVTQR